MNIDDRPCVGHDLQSSVDFWACLRLFVRRWYVVLPVLLIALAGAAATFSSIPSRYAAQSTLMLTMPPSGGVEFNNGYVPNKVNPLLNMDSGLNLTGTMLIQSMRTSKFLDQLDVPPDVSFAVNNGSDNPELLVEGPFVFVSAEADDPATAQQLVRRAVAASQIELDRLQSGVGAPDVTRIRPYVIDPEAVPTSRHGSAVRATAAVLALGMIGTVGSAFAAESVAMASRRRRRTHAVLPTVPRASGPERHTVLTRIPEQV